MPPRRHRPRRATPSRAASPSTDLATISTPSAGPATAIPQQQPYHRGEYIPTRPTSPLDWVLTFAIPHSKWGRPTGKFIIAVESIDLRDPDLPDIRTCTISAVDLMAPLLFQHAVLRGCGVLIIPPLDFPWQAVVQAALYAGRCHPQAESRDGESMLFCSRWVCTVRTDINDRICEFIEDCE